MGLSLFAKPNIRLFQLKKKQKQEMENGWTVKERGDADFRRTVIESDRLEKEYAHYFDSRIINRNFESTFDQLNSEILNLETQYQWVPVSWVF